MASEFSTPKNEVKRNRIQSSMEVLQPKPRHMVAKTARPAIRPGIYVYMKTKNEDQHMMSITMRKKLMLTAADKILKTSDILLKRVLALEDISTDECMKLFRLVQQQREGVENLKRDAQLMAGDVDMLLRFKSPSTVFNPIKRRLSFTVNEEDEQIENVLNTAFISGL